jgi:hypothetical protein
VKKENSVRVFARKLASELTHQELAAISGQGTSYYGTGDTDAAGRRSDWTSGDSTQGWDRYYPY